VLLAVAAQIRAGGDWPGMPALRAAVESAGASVAGLVTGPVPEPATAAVLATAALGARSGAVRVQHDGARPAPYGSRGNPLRSGADNCR
jgi:hypothetical protein